MMPEKKESDTLKLLIKVVICMITFMIIVFGSCAGLLFQANAQQDEVIIKKADEKDLEKFEIKFKDYSDKNEDSHEKIEKKIVDFADKFEEKLDKADKKIDDLTGNVIKILTILERE